MDVHGIPYDHSYCLYPEMSKACPSPTETVTFLLFDKNRLRFPEVVDRVVRLVEQRLFYWIHGPAILGRPKGSEFRAKS